MSCANTEMPVVNREIHCWVLNGLIFFLYNIYQVFSNKNFVKKELFYILFYIV